MAEDYGEPWVINYNSPSAERRRQKEEEMSNVYEKFFGDANSDEVLLACLGIDPADVPRFRGCSVENDAIVVRTRTGGDNRKDWEEEHAELTRREYYLFDEDDWDTTYALFSYRFPPEYAADLRAWAARDKTWSPSERWQAIVASVKAKKNGPSGPESSQGVA